MKLSKNIVALSIIISFNFTPVSAQNSCFLSPPGFSETQLGEEKENKQKIIKDVTRRGFLSFCAALTACLLMDAFAPSFLKGEMNKEYITNINELSALSLEYLESLSKKEAEEYFIRIEQSINNRSIPRLKAGRFLWHVFQQSDIVWMRAEAIKILITYQFLTFEEVKSILNITPESDIVQKIYDALAENPTKEIILFLRKMISEELRININMTAFLKSLEKSKNIPQEIIDEIVEVSKNENYFSYGTSYMSYRMIPPEVLGILAKKDPEIHKIMIQYWNNIKKPSHRYYLPYVLASAGTPEAEKLLLDASRNESLMENNAWAIIGSLADLNTKASINRIFELSHKIPKKEIYFRSVVSALNKINTSESAKRLVELSYEFEHDEEKVINLLYCLGKHYNPDIEKRLIELSRNENKDIRKISVYSLDDLGTTNAEARLIEMSRNETDIELARFIIQSLGNINTPAAKTRLLEIYEETLKQRTYYLFKYELLNAMAEYDTKDTLDWFIKQLNTQQNLTATGIASTLFHKITGFNTSKILRQMLAESDMDEGKIEYLKSVIKEYMEEIDNLTIRDLNTDIDFNVQTGEKQMALFFNRFKNSPETMYLFLALSQEITSHSFPMLYNNFINYVRLEEKSNFIEYINNKFDDHFMTNFLFTLLIFNELESAFENTKYEPKYLSDILFT